MVLQDEYFDKYCEKCDKQYTVMKYKWCKLCQSSGNKQIDNFIHESAENKSTNDIVFGLIPYNQFGNIKEIGRNNFTKLYSATWNGGPLYYCDEFKRRQNEKVTLKYSYDNLQNSTEEFLNEV